MKIKPLFDRILIKIGNEIHTTEGGIVLPHTSQERPLIGTVEAVGTGDIKDGEKTKIVLKIGDRVMYDKYTGCEITINDNKYLLVQQADILAVVEE